VLDAGGHGCSAVGDRRHDLDVVAEREQQLERLPEDVVVLDEEDSDRPGQAYGPWLLARVRAPRSIPVTL
jgi:hypothetical protein